MGHGEEHEPRAQVVGDREEDWKREKSQVTFTVRRFSIFLFQMWRDLPEEDKQEYIDEYEVEKVRTFLKPFDFI